MNPAWDGENTSTESRTELLCPSEQFFMVPLGNIVWSEVKSGSVNAFLFLCVSLFVNQGTSSRVWAQPDRLRGSGLLVPGPRWGIMNPTNSFSFRRWGSVLQEMIRTLTHKTSQTLKYTHSSYNRQETFNQQPKVINRMWRNNVQDSVSYVCYAAVFQRL